MATTKQPNIYEANRYKAIVIEWKDGDTVKLYFDLGQDTIRRRSYRLADIDAPEIRRYRGVTQEEKERGLALKDEMNRRYPPGTELICQTFKERLSRYGVIIWTSESPVSLNKRLLDEGLVEPWEDE
jgi:endonuclease YncB( thermonuclease family)